MSKEHCEFCGLLLFLLVFCGGFVVFSCVHFLLCFACLYMLCRWCCRFVLTLVRWLLIKINIYLLFSCVHLHDLFLFLSHGQREHRPDAQVYCCIWSVLALTACKHASSSRQLPSPHICIVFLASCVLSPFCLWQSRFFGGGFCLTEVKFLLFVLFCFWRQIWRSDSVFASFLFALGGLPCLTGH